MKILCETCGKDMEYKEQSCSPGSNDPCLIVVPCCAPADISDELAYIKDETMPELFEYITSIIDAVDNFMELIKEENCYHDSKEQRQEIEDCTITMLNTIKDFIK